MKNKLIVSFCCLAVLFNIFIINQLKAVSAYPNPIEIDQPDGTKLTVQLRGDEHVKWAETNDGYSLMYNKKGVFEYAISDGEGGMMPSGVAATNVRSSQVNDLLAKTPKNLRYSQGQVSMLKSIQNLKSAQSRKAFPTKGNRKLVCILMGFKDKPFTKSRAEFDNLFNQLNYSKGAAAGSVRDYYEESSYGQLDLQVTVAGPFKASRNMSYYGGNGSSGHDSRPRELITEAVNAADPTVNFANFDNDNDGTVDGVYVIYAGYGEEAGGGANALWAHAWNINPIRKDGKKVSGYSCSAELRGRAGSTITAIGVICHEFGHVLGAPDYYDTDYTNGGNFTGTGQWDMMAAGSWNRNGDVPAQHNAYTKIYVYGWASATTLSSAKNVTVNNSVENKSFYRINSKTSNEYWLMENRQKLGFDAALPGHGLMIYHVHNRVNSSGNSINATYPQKMYPVCASAKTNPGSSPSSYGSINSGGCTFPGTSGKKSFTDATVPSMKSWAGASTNAPITNIKEAGRVITFKFKNGGTTTNNDIKAPTAPTNLRSSNLTSTSVKLSWNASKDNVGVTEYFVYQNGKEIKTVKTTNATITGLKAESRYTFFVRAGDAAGNKSASSNSVKVTTPKAQQNYCSSKGQNAASEWIDYVELGGMKNTTGSNGGYADFTGKVATVQAGSRVTIYISAGFKSSSYNEFWNVWIDWNKNGVFESNELMIKGSSSKSTKLSASFNVPSNASGTTRMRVSMKYKSNGTACETFSYGEVEDYTVSVKAYAPEMSEMSLSSANKLGNQESVYNFHVSPNPVKGNVMTIQFADTRNTQFSIYNLLGGKMKEGQLNAQHNEVDVYDLEQGVYIIKVNDGQKELVKKFIKE
ncbi:MAG: M6 family metalloprotease domain-containing protein [Bacteroidales bacterium]|nr:M6 family metalloprotease domain-containing protein [Bacteroidales bacterium]